MWITIVLILFYLLMPVLLIYLCKISNTLNRVGAVVLAYAVGLVLGNIGLLPTASDALIQVLGGTRSFLPNGEFQEFMKTPGFTASDETYNHLFSAFFCNTRVTHCKSITD
jgi:peptidoglycan/LPS O-acetylase OafA/YrhL